MSQVIEWSSDKLEPKAAWWDEEEFYGVTVTAESVAEDEVALHIVFPPAALGDDQDGRESSASIYLTPSQATLLAERLRTGAFIAEAHHRSDA